MIVKRRLKGRTPQGVCGPFWSKGLERRSAPLDERAMSIFQPDILIEPQYQSTYRGRYHLGPERTLMLAVLQDAVGCYQEHATAVCQRRRAMHQEAEQWIVSRDRSYLFSFENVCEALGYDADYVRQGLLRWKETMSEQRKRSRHPSLIPAKRGSDAGLEPAAPGRYE